MSTRTPATLTATLIATLAAFAALGAQSEPVVTTRHRLRIASTETRYTAQAGRVDIPDSATGEVHARMFFAAYRRPGDAPERPVMFLWNGGPGSPSSTLEFESVGPKLLDHGRLIDNPQTILPHADLVFVDAVGTGFSRVTRAEHEHEFYNTLGDVGAFAAFVQAWLRLYGRTGAPVFLAGESFGSARAAGVAVKLLESHARVRGIVLVSGGLAIRHTLPREVAAALRVPEWAAVARYHGRVAADVGGDTAAIVSAARAWATSTYAPALVRVGSLDDAQRDSIVEALSRFTGIEEALIDRRSLVITARQFRTELLRNRGQTLALFDMRRTSPIAYTRAERQAMTRFIRDSLGYRTPLAYVGLDTMSSAVNEHWDYFAPGTTAEQRAASIAEAVRTGDGPPGVDVPWTERALALDPGLRVLVAKGTYDDGSCLATEQSIRRLPEALRTAFTFRCYAAGHMMYKDAAARERFSNDLTAFVSAAVASR